MSNIDQTDVLVAGAGPVGMLTALLLTQHGIKTRIIDQSPQIAGRSYSCALHPASLQILQEAGVAADAIKVGFRIDSVGFYQGEARRAEIKFSSLGSPFSFGLVLEQSVLESLLENKLKQAGVSVEWNHRATDLQLTEDGAALAIETLGTTGKGYSVPDFDSVVLKKRPTRAKYVVGADGPKSLVRRRLKVSTERAGAAEHFAVFEVGTKAGCEHEVRVVLDDTSASVLWPLSEGHCRWGFQINPDADGDDFPDKDRDRLLIAESPSEQDSLHHLRRYVQSRAPWFKQEIEEVRWATDVQFEPWMATHFGKDNCWLVGDAAHQTCPVGMQSMNIGFREAAELTGILAEILRRGGSHELLRGYDKGRQAEWRRLLGVKSANGVTKDATEWVRSRVDRIVGSIPASGAELTKLAGTLGIVF